MGILFLVVRRFLFPLNLIEKRIINKSETEDEAVYFSINHHIATYVNSTKIKFVDLYKGFINYIVTKILTYNAQSYSITHCNL